MAGGTFDPLAGKIRPGTYINFESARRDVVGIGERGIVLIPLVSHSYGPAKRFITIDGFAPDAFKTMLGFSVYDDNPGMLLIREAFKNASTVIVYIPNQGASATVTSGALTATAMYGGSRGNDLKVSVTPNPVAGFDVTVFLGGAVVSNYQGLATIEGLIAMNDSWITFSGTGALTAIAGVSLADGEDGTLVAGDITDFLDASESIRWNTMAFPLDATGPSGASVPALYTALASKIKYLRESAGKYRKAVLPGYVANYEGIINVTNSVTLVGGVDLTAAQATAWVAGKDAGALNTQSNTYRTYVGAVGIVGQKNNAESEMAIINGEFFFSFSEQGEVIVEYDINSLTDFSPPKDKTYSKNRVIRVFDTFAESLMLNFPPNRFNNDPVGWDIMEGIGRAILKQFLDAGVIKNVDYGNDFAVDRGKSSGDETYFNVGLEPADSAEKLFFTIKTR